jgi:tetratricopeptide (TPR) repeat protein/tRNA A-37 threonylcarbamoyl transferase component Bud32
LALSPRSIAVTPCKEPTMSILDPNEGTVDFDPARMAEAIRREFEAAWQEALSGGAPPRIDVYLAQAPEAVRPALQDDLRRIEDDYRPRRVLSGGPNTECIPADPSAQPATLEFGPAGASATDAGQRRVRPGGQDTEHIPADSSAQPATLEFGPAGASATDAGDFSLAPDDPDAAPAEGPVVAGYEILEELGRGGMGVVYLARQLKLHRPAALKMVLAGAHAGAHQLARFYTEAEAVARLQHPHIVQIYEIGESDGLPFLSLEYVSGGSLARKIGGKPQPPRDAAEVVEQLAEAMAAAHAAGIIHRDLKPANVLLTRDGQPKITDFGLAKRLEDDSSQTKSGTLMGTPSYMSPEQANGQVPLIGPLSDLYALGAILYELLTGRPPFVGPTMLETLTQVRNDEPVPPTRLQPKVPRDLETICLKCLQKEPRQRYEGAAALADDLHRYLGGEPIKARPVGRFERAWRWCRRNPRVAVLSACVGALVLAVAASLVVIAVRLGREREAVAEARTAAGQRLEQAAEAAAGGDYRRAQDLLRRSDTLLGSHPDLADVRAELETLTAQVDVYAEFRELLDSARFACRFGSRRLQEEGRRHCHQLLALYDAIEGRTGRGAAGLPPLDDRQQTLFREDVFEAFLTAAQVERDLAAGGGAEAERKAARQALGWLNRAEQILPGTRALRVYRAPCWGLLGDRAADQADVKRALATPPASAVDHFWHGFATYQRGGEARARKDLKAAHDFYRLAMAEYAEFLRLRPDHFWGYFNWANCHAQINERADLYDALIGFTACMRLRPDFPWPYNNRGTVLHRLGQNELAVADFTAALARNEHYAEAYANRGLAYLALKKTDLALKDFGRAVALNPDYAPAYTERAAIYRERKQYGKAAADYTRLLDLGGDKAALYEKRAEAYRALNRPEEAAADYGRLIGLKPKNLQARAARAEVLFDLKKYAEARDDFTRILEAAPRAAPIRRARAVLNWQNLKDFDAALTDWWHFARLMPADPEPYRCIGVILLGRRQYGPALEALQQALVLKPDYAEAIWARAQIYLWQGKPEEALKELDPPVSKLPQGLPETLNVRAAVLQALGRLEEAAADYRRMIAVKPKEPEAYTSLARLYQKQGQSKQAAECFDKLVAAAPDSAWAYLRRAEYRRDRGEFDAALADCDRAARLDPGWALPALVRASTEAARGRPGPAVAEAERALAKAPKHDGRVLYAAACVWSLASRAAADPGEAGRYADRAAALLAEALDKGFHDLLYPEHNRMADDPALDPIRRLPRVQALLDRSGERQERKPAP